MPTDTPTSTPAAQAATPASAPLTSVQRSALIDEAARGMTPEHLRKKPFDPLAAWRPQIVRQFKKGFSGKQIVAQLASPKIGIKTSVRSLQRLLESVHKTATPPAKPGASK